MAGFTETATLRLIDATTPNLRKINTALTRLNTASRSLTTTINSLNTALNRLGSARLTTNLTRTTNTLTTQINRLRAAQRGLNSANIAQSINGNRTPIIRGNNAAAAVAATANRRQTTTRASRNGASIIEGNPIFAGGQQNYATNIFRSALGAYAGVSFLSAVKRAFQEGFQEVTEAAQRQAATFTYPGQNQANLLFAQGESQRLRGALSRSQVLDILSELGSGGLSQPDHVDSLRYVSGRVNDFLIQVQTRLAVPFEEAERGMRDIIRVLEETGHLYDGQFDRYFNALTKVSLVEGKFLPLNMLRSSVVFSRQAGQTMSSEGLANLAILTGMMGFTAGRSLNSVVRKFLGANTTQTALAEQQRLGLVSAHLEPIPGSRRSRTIVDRTLGERQLAEDPVGWVRDVAWPVIAKDLAINPNNDTEIRTNIAKIARAMNRVTGEQLAASTMLQIITGRKQLDAVKGAAGATLSGQQSLDVIMRNALVSFRAAGNEIRTLFGTTTSALSVRLLPAVELVSTGFNNLNKWLVGDGNAEGIAARATIMAKIAVSGVLTSLYVIFGRIPAAMGAPQIKSAATDLRIASVAIRGASTQALQQQQSANFLRSAGSSMAAGAGFGLAATGARSAGIGGGTITNPQQAFLLAQHATRAFSQGQTQQEAQIKAAAAKEAKRYARTIGTMAAGLALSTLLDIGSNIANTNGDSGWARGLGMAANISGLALIGGQIGAAFGPIGLAIGAGAGALIGALVEFREPLYNAFISLASTIRSATDSLFVGIAKGLNVIPESGNIEEAGLWAWFTQSREQRLRGIDNYNRGQFLNSQLINRSDSIDRGKMNFTSEDLYRSIYGSPVPPGADSGENYKNIGEQMAKGFQSAINPCGIQATIRQGNPFRYTQEGYTGGDSLSRA